MNTLISVIIPVYNSSPYLNDCIQSVLHQTYQNFELILVNDGSQDDSKNICEKISSTDKRITFINQEHRGVSAARNNALKFATGEYLFFLDSDDAIHTCLLETMHSILSSTNATMAAAEYQFISASKLPDAPKNQNPSSYSGDYIYLDNRITLDSFVRGYTNTLYGIGGIMVRRVKAQSLRFDEQLLIGEDTKFIYQMLLQGADIIILNKKWYYYRKTKNYKDVKHTINSYQSMYMCESYIRDSEIKEHRNINAISKEQALLIRICEWYIIGRQTHDVVLCNYLRKISAKESASKIFLQAKLCIRIKFFLIFHCPPLYWTIHVSYKIYEKFIKFSRKSNGITDTIYPRKFLKGFYYAKNILSIDKLHEQKRT